MLWGGINSYAYFSPKHSGLKVKLLRRYKNAFFMYITERGKIKTFYGSETKSSQHQFLGHGGPCLPSIEAPHSAQATGHYFECSLQVALLSFSPWLLYMSRNLLQNSEPVTIFALAVIREAKTPLIKMAIMFPSA